jgi:hypothetical protein
MRLDRDKFAMTYPFSEVLLTTHGKRAVSQWLNLPIETGFQLARVEEPRPSDETVHACPDMQDAQVVAYID